MELSSGQKTVLKALAISNHGVTLCDSRIAVALERKKLVKMVGVSHSRCQYIVLTAKGRGVGEKLIG